MSPNFKFRKRNRQSRLTRHHDKAKSLGGKYTHANIFLLTEEHHQAYHKLFGLMTFKQAAEVLMRLDKKHKGGSREPETPQVSSSLSSV